MTRDENSTNESERSHRGLGWAAIVIGAILCLGIVSSVANGTGTSTGGAAETAGMVIGRLIVLAIGIAAIWYGVRRVR